MIVRNLGGLGKASEILGIFGIFVRFSIYLLCMACTIIEGLKSTMHTISRIRGIESAR